MSETMNGAEALVRTLLAGGVDTCFANPGTSEMHFVAALDRFPAMRCVLALFEGVATGAADGYARMADKPAATLLHLGAGLANGLANLHNARRANTPMVNVIGDHATYHRALDAPLTSDVEAVARTWSHWVRSTETPASVGPDTAEAIRMAMSAPGKLASLILPGDAAWDMGGVPAPAPVIAPRRKVADGAIELAARALTSGEPCLLLVGGMGGRAAAMANAGRIAAKTGAKLLAPTSNARMERGAGRVNVDRVPYPVDMAVAALSGLRHIILVGAKAPVGFFAYPGKPGKLYPPDCAVHLLADPADDIADALARLSERVGGHEVAAPITQREAPTRATGPITLEGIAHVVAANLPENAIVADESITAGRNFFPYTKAAAPHDWLQITGGAIGIGLPLALGAAIACPDRPVVCLEADGSAMYTIQALWSQAREQANVTNVILNNGSYATLRGELANVGAHNPGPTALGMIDLGRPALDFVALAKGMGVPAVAVDRLEDFDRAFQAAVTGPGPNLIEVRI